MISQKHFIAGPDHKSKRVVINKTFDKSITNIILDVPIKDTLVLTDSFPKMKSQIDSDLTYIFKCNGVVLQNLDKKVIGVYLGDSFAIDSEYRSQGLGTEMIIVYYMHYKCFPNWKYGWIGFTAYGHRCMEKAWVIIARIKDSIGDKNSNTEENIS